MMQAIGRQYVRYFNFSYKRTGTLWQGRFKSCLVDEESYLLHLYRYIELNPVRAGMIEHPADYAWSSYSINALNKTTELCSPHFLYLALGRDKAERQENYRALFNHHVEETVLDEVRLTVNKGLVLGNERFKAEIESLTGRRMKPKSMGRPLGWRKEKLEVN